MLMARFLKVEVDENKEITKVLEMASALHIAARSGNVEKVRMLLHERRTYVDCTDSLNQTPAHYAVLKGRLDVLRVLVSEFNADLSNKDCMGNTPLLLAAKCKQNNIIFALILEYHCPVDDTTKNGETIFDLCCQYKNAIALSFLCNNGLSPRKSDSFGNSLLHYVCEWGDDKLANALVKKHNADISALNNENSTPFDIAVANCNVKLILMFLDEFGYDPNRADFHGKTILHYACEWGDIELASTLVKKHKVDVSVLNKDKSILFDDAVVNRNVKLISMFLDEFGYDPNRADFHGKTILHYACEWGDVKLASILVKKHKVDISVLNKDKSTLFDDAVVNRNVKLISMFLDEFGYDPNRADFHGNTILHYACEWGDVKLASILVKKHKVDISALNHKNNTPFDIAVANCKVKLISMFLDEFGYDPNRADFHGKTILHFACEWGDVELASILVKKHKVDVSALNHENNTPFDIAVANCKVKLISMFLDEFGYDPNRADFHGKTILHFACEWGDVELASILVKKHKVDVSALNHENNTPFDIAVANCKVKLISMFLDEFGYDPNRADFHGNTILHYACEWGDVKLASTLVKKHKVDVSALNHENNTPFDIAVANCKVKLISMFLDEFGYDPNRADFHGKTILHYACEWGDIELASTLVKKHKVDVSVLNKDKSILFDDAVVNRNVKLISMFLDEFGYDPNRADFHGKTILHYACEWGDIELASTLVKKHKVDISALNNENNTPFDIAVANCNVKFISMFLDEFGYSPNRADLHGKTILHYACEWGDIELASTLVKKHKVDISALNNENNTPFDIAVANCNVNLISMFLDEFGYSPNRADLHGKTILHYACEWGDIELASTLVKKHKIDVSVLNEDKSALFDDAVVNHNVKLISMFLDEFGYDPNRADFHGKTILQYACEWGDIELASTLVKKHKVDISALNNENNTPFDIAVANCNVKLISMFLDEFGYDPNRADFHGKTILHYACEWGDVELASTLVKKHKVDISVLGSEMGSLLDSAFSHCNFKLIILFGDEFPNAADKHGRTLLHSACRFGENTIVEHLLKSTSPLLTDKDGNTPLHLASKTNSLECLKLLVKAKVPLLVRNEEGLTPSDMAVGESKEFLADYMKQNSKQIQASYKKVLSHARKKYSGSHFITRVFVIGNPGAGKSSFIESLKREGFLRSFRKVSESSVPPHTAGIIPSVHMSKRYGRVLFYDFAGDAEYYSSHAAIFESIASSKKGDNMFILVVNLREDDDVIETTLYYWLSFIQYQKFHNLSLIVVGSHLDSSAFSAESKTQVLERFCAGVHYNVHNVTHFMLDCRNPRSNQIAQFKRQILTWVHESRKYDISNEASLLLGLLEKDFGAVTACPVKTIQSHIKDCGVWVPTDAKALHQVLLELHDVGVFLVLGDYTKEYYHTILNISKLTNEVHKLLFAESALSNLERSHSSLKAVPFNIGILPENVLSEILPSHITKECLIHFQYCQQISHSDVGIFPSLEGSDTSDSTDKAFLFFPAFCSLDKSEVSWEASSGKGFSFSWLALCTNSHDYFPSRFLHVLLLRLVHSFALSVPAEAAPVSSQYSRRCTMWKKGVHWKMEEGVDCTVELVNESKGVVIHCNSSDNNSEVCANMFVRIVGCVMEAKTEFCYSVKPHFFLLDSSDEADYLSHDHLFALSDVERTLKHPKGKEMIISVSGRGEMALSKLQCLHRLTHWDSLFPITSDAILHLIKETAIKLHEFGQSLGAPHHVIKNIEKNFPYDASRGKSELVRWWVSSFQSLPCWWHLVQALEEIYENVLAKKIREDHGPHIQLQEKLLGKEIQAQKPDEEFLCSFSHVMGSRWSSLAVSLALSEGEIEDLKGKVGLTQEELALEMLKIWSLKEEATFGQLCLTLRTITLFQYSS